MINIDYKKLIIDNISTKIIVLNNYEIEILYNNLNIKNLYSLLNFLIDPKCYDFSNVVNNFSNPDELFFLILELKKELTKEDWVEKYFLIREICYLMNLEMKNKMNLFHCSNCYLENKYKKILEQKDKKLYNNIKPNKNMSYNNIENLVDDVMYNFANIGKNYLEQMINKNIENVKNVEIKPEFRSVLSNMYENAKEKKYTSSKQNINGSDEHKDLIDLGIVGNFINLISNQQQNTNNKLKSTENHYQSYLNNYINYLIDDITRKDILSEKEIWRKKYSEVIKSIEQYFQNLSFDSLSHMDHILDSSSSSSDSSSSSSDSSSLELSPENTHFTTEKFFSVVDVFEPHEFLDEKTINQLIDISHEYVNGDIHMLRFLIKNDLQSKFVIYLLNIVNKYMLQNKVMQLENLYSICILECCIWNRSEYVDEIFEIFAMSDYHYENVKYFVKFGYVNDLLDEIKNQSFWYLLVKMYMRHKNNFDDCFSCMKNQGLEPEQIKDFIEFIFCNETSFVNIVSLMEYIDSTNDIYYLKNIVNNILPNINSKQLILVIKTFLNHLSNFYSQNSIIEEFFVENKNYLPFIIKKVLIFHHRNLLKLATNNLEKNMVERLFIEYIEYIEPEKFDYFFNCLFFRLKNEDILPMTDLIKIIINSQISDDYKTSLISQIMN